MIGVLQITDQIQGGAIFSTGTVVYGVKYGDRTTLVSTSDLVTWNDVFTFDDTITSIHVTDNGTILVGTDASNNGDAFGTPDGVIRRSTDNGQTFTSVLEYFQGTPIHWSIDSLGNDVYAATYGEYGANKLYKSTDDGETWGVAYEHSRSENIHFHQVHIDRHEPTHVYLAVGDIDVDGNRSVYRSTDSGVTFSRLFDWFITTILATEEWIYFGGESPHKNQKMVVFRMNRSTQKLEFSRWDVERDYPYRGWVSDIKEGPNGEIYICSTATYPSSSTDSPRGYVSESWDHGTTWDDIYLFENANGEGQNRIKQFAIFGGKVLMLGDLSTCNSYIYTPNPLSELRPAGIVPSKSLLTINGSIS
jgi:hypothetical protein